MIKIRNLSKRYRKQTVLDRVCLDIPSGSIFALLGPNGSGKTTLLKSILGLVHPEPASEIWVAGRPVIGGTDYKKRIGYLPQFPKFPAHLKVSELIALFEKLRQSEGVHKEPLRRVMQVDGFWNKAFGELSGGMAQKVNSVQFFMFEQALNILDEQTSGLDPQAAFSLKQWIREKKSKGATIVFTSHVMSEVDELADGRALMIDGRLDETLYASIQE